MIEADGARRAKIRRELRHELVSGLILQRVVTQAVLTVEGCDHAGISLRVNQSEVQTPVWTSADVSTADALQRILDEGPSLEPQWVSDHILVRDLSTNRRWPNWGPEVLLLGLNGLLSVRLDGGPETVAALNLYSGRVDGFGAQSLDQARVLAAQASKAITAAHTATNFESAMSTRHAVGLAQGILGYRYGFSQERALTLLRDYSVTSEVSLRDAAEELVLPGLDE